MEPVISSIKRHFGLELRFVLGSLLLALLGCVAWYGLPMLHGRLYGALALYAVCTVLAASMAHYAWFQPYRRLVLVTRAVGSGDVSRRVSRDGSHELGSLAWELNRIFEQLEAAQRETESHAAALSQLRHSDRLATLGRLASSMAHELGNPLNVIELRAQLVSSGDVSSLQQAQQNALIIVDQTRRMTRIIGEMLSFARTQSASIVQLDLVAILRRALAFSEHISRRQQTEIQLSLHAQAITLAGDGDKLLQMLVNLVINGIQAMAGSGTLTVSTGETDQHYVYVDIVDQGSGMAPEVLSKVFEPFFSTKSADGGTGLGLSVAQGIALEHAGWISVTSEVGRGSAFRVYLPQGGHEQPSEDEHTRQAAIHRR